MPRIVSSKQVVNLKRGRGVSKCSISICEEPKDDEKKEQINEIVSKLSKMKIVNPKNGAKAKMEIKNKFISI